MDEENKERIGSDGWGTECWNPLITEMWTSERAYGERLAVSSLFQSRLRLINLPTFLVRSFTTRCLRMQNRTVEISQKLSDW